jgi:predicted nucleic acid-binding protein
MGIMYWLLDNSVLSNFSLAGEIGLLKEKLQEKLAIPEEVKKEFLLGIENRIVPETDINWLRILKRTDDEERLFERFCSRLGKGESACLAITINRKYKLFTDDIDARNTAQRFEVPVSGTIGMLTYLVYKGYISLEEGNKILSEMISKGYYSPIEILDDLIK